MPTEEETEIQTEAEKVSEESKVHAPVKHPFKYPTDRVANINKKISISIKFPDGMRIAKTGITSTPAMVTCSSSCRRTKERLRWRISKIMPMTQDEKWKKNYEEVVTFIKANKRNPSKYIPEEKTMVNWQKQQRKLINAGLLKPERVGMFNKLQYLVEKYKRVNQYQ